MRQNPQKEIGDFKIRGISYLNFLPQIMNILIGFPVLHYELHRNSLGTQKAHMKNWNKNQRLQIEETET